MENKANSLDTVFQDLQSSFNQAPPQSQKNFWTQLTQWVKQQEVTIFTPADLHSLFSSVPQLIQVADKIEQAIWIRELKTNQILYVSPAFETIWGFSGDNLYQNPNLLIESVHPEDRKKVVFSIANGNQQPFNQSYRILRPDGAFRWIFSRTFIIHDENQEPFYYFCIAEDITVQNITEQNLRKSLERTHKQFSLSRKMSLARKPETVLKILMSTYELRSAFRAALLFFDSPKIGPTSGVEILATWQLNPNIPEWINESNLYDEAALWELVNEKQPVIINDIKSDPHLYPQVREFLLDEKIKTLIIFPLVALGDWVGGLFVYYHQKHYFEMVDLRHLKVIVDQASITLYNLKLLSAEEELRREAELANEIKSKFLAMISHELRTPLTSIIGYTTTLLAKDVHWDPEEQTEFIQTIQVEGFRLQELIDHLLDLSRLEAGTLPITPEPVSFHKILEDAMPQLQVLTSGKTLTFQTPSNLPMVVADVKRISQVLVNLVHNSVVYAPRGSEIRITANKQKGFLKINVIDQGPGIPPSEHKRVFRAFHRGIIGDKELLKGAGLGLAICKGLIEAHKGRIWINRKTTPGTTVSFTLPINPDVDIINNIEVS